MNDGNEIDGILISYLKLEITKQELKDKLSNKNISITKFNTYILDMLENNLKNCETLKMDISLKYHGTYRSFYKYKKMNSLKLDKMLSSTFLQDIKKSKLIDRDNNIQSSEPSNLNVVIDANENLPLYRRCDVLNTDLIFYRLNRFCKMNGLSLNPETNLNPKLIPNFIEESCISLCKSIVNKCIKKDNVTVDEAKMKKLIREKYSILTFTKFENDQ